MMNLSQNTIIYIASPYVETGGPKSLHQLANVLIKEGIQVKIFYYDDKYLNQKKSLFDECNAEICDKISLESDVEENILIVPETFTGLLNEYKKIQKVIWWLSLDFYLYRKQKIITKTTNHIGEKYHLPRFLVPILKRIVTDMIEKAIPSIKPIELKKYMHMFNCEYVHNYLLEQGVSEENMHYLCGPLEREYYAVSDSIIDYKKNIVSYNPSKVKELYIAKVKKKVQENNPEIKFVAIKGMNREEVFNTLKETKVYIDLGFFPGPERMPREAVSLYCNIITSKIGAAKFYDDVPIPWDYKFELLDENISTIATLIIDMCENYRVYKNSFLKYRKKVNSQIEGFEKDVRDIFISEGVK